MKLNKMLNSIDVSNWTPFEVQEWIIGLCDDTGWLKSEEIIKNKIGGKQLLFMTPEGLELLGISKVSIQEHILEAIENLRFYSYNMITETLQAAILRLGCQSRSLQKQLAPAKRAPVDRSNSSSSKTIVLSPEFEDKSATKGQRVSLDTLASVSSIVKTVRYITDILSCLPFSKHDDYRSMKSLLLALSIELTSTAQRDQFVERPNDIIGKSSKALADYCDRIVDATSDPLLIEPFQLETVEIRKNLKENDLGLVVKSLYPDSIHLIDKILPLSPAKKTNKLSEGDEILQFNQSIVGWSPKNVERLLSDSSKLEGVVLMVKKRPTE